MNRHSQWDARLVSTVRDHFDKPHRWGEHDCLLWCAKAVEAVTGEDHAAEHRGKYDSFAKAYRHLSTLGFDSPEAFLDSLFEEKPVGFAARGDLVLGANGIPMVCMGRFALCVGEDGEREGLFRVPRSDWVKAWAVGEHHSSC